MKPFKADIQITTQPDIVPVSNDTSVNVHIRGQIIHQYHATTTIKNYIYKPERDNMRFVDVIVNAKTAADLLRMQALNPNDTITFDAHIDNNNVVNIDAVVLEKIA